MKERPIIFNAPMVRAILADAKTQTRRIVKESAFRGHLLPGGLDAAVSRSPRLAASFCPYGQPGDQLWVRESFSDIAGGTRQYFGDHVAYRADPLQPLVERWTPSIHMPRWACRIRLEIAAVRVERLQDISEADARAEGMAGLSKDGGKTIKYGIPDSDGLPGGDDYGWYWADWQRDPRMAYQHLWEKINGAGGWAANPWVWVVEFKAIKAASHGNRH